MKKRVNTESTQTQRSGVRRSILWVSKNEFRSNHIESLFTKLKHWARGKTSGKLVTCGANFHLYLSDFALRHNCSLVSFTEYVEQLMRAFTGPSPVPVRA